ncbi:MAG: xanthine dehydrogenase molybdopterin binding subunit [Pseudomonadota bacterium]
MSIARAEKHDSAPLHVTGAARYVDDSATPADALHLAFGLSTIAHGTITALDLERVRGAEGVVAVLTAGDLPGANDVSPSGDGEPLLCRGDVHYKGQPIFIVAARSHLLARRAARLAKISYDTQPAVITMDEAIAAGNRLEDPLVFSRGDAEAALSDAPRVIEGVLDVGGQEHFYLEGQGAMAVPGEAGEMVVHSSSQHPSEIQHKVAEALGVPFSAIGVQVRRMGGGFGGKESQGNSLAVACAVIAARTGRVVKMRYDRDDDFVITGKRHEIRVAYRAGVDEDGRILGIDIRHWVRCGWSKDLSLPVADRAMLHSDNAYLLPHVRITSERLKTNTVSNTAFRGFGGPQGMVGIERVMDHIAAELGRDPLKVRRANFYEGQGQLTPYHMPVEDNVIREIVDELETACNYTRRREEIAAWNAANPVLKKGIALTPVKFGISFTLTHLNQAGALVHVYTDGSIRLNHGGTEMGQGLFTKVAQVAAEVFGQPISAVKITATDTTKVPNTSATAASSGSDLNGMATKRACDTIRDRLADFAAERWQVTPDKVVFADGVVRIGEAEVAFTELVQAAYMARISLSATGFYATPKLEWDRFKGRGRPFFYFAYGAACSEVVVDTLTGENRILRTDIIHDVGQSLNPAVDTGQIEGAFVQGAGWLTMEELVWDDSGTLRTHAPSTYKIPACSDRPGSFNVHLWEKGWNREETIYRSKAVGEPPFMLGISVLSALQDAVRAAGGNPLFDAPATPERLLNAIETGRGRGW